MLLALALGGLAAAFAAPLLLSTEEDEEDAPVTTSEGDDAEEMGSLLEFEDDQDMPRAFEVRAGPGEYVLEHFDPEADTCLVTFDDTDVVVETGWGEDGVPFFKAGTAGGDFSLSFPGLDDVPANAVTILSPEGSDGEEVSLSLAEVLRLGALPGGADLGSTMVFDGGEEHPASIIDETLEDLAGLSPVLPGLGEAVDGVADMLDDLMPLPPGVGELVDEATAPLDDLLPVAPTDPEADDSLPTPLVDLDPVAPNPGEEREPHVASGQSSGSVA